MSQKNPTTKRNHETHAASGRSGLHPLRAGGAADLRHHHHPPQKGGGGLPPPVSESGRPHPRRRPVRPLPDRQCLHCSADGDRRRRHGLSERHPLFWATPTPSRLYNNGLISLQAVLRQRASAPRSRSTGASLPLEGFQPLPIPQAVAMMKPPCGHVPSTPATPDGSLGLHRPLHGLIQAIQQSYPTPTSSSTRCRRSRLTTQLPPHGPGQDRRLQHGPSGSLRAAGRPLPSTRRGPQGQRRLRHRGLLHQRRHPPQERRPQAVLNLSRTHALQTEDRRPTTATSPPAPWSMSQPASSPWPLQLRGCQLQRESGRAPSSELFQREHQRGKKFRGPLPCGQERRRHSERRQ